MFKDEDLFKIFHSKISESTAHFECQAKSEPQSISFKSFGLSTGAFIRQYKEVDPFNFLGGWEALAKYLDEQL